ncbi:MAG: hypothetical protein VR74_18870 [Hyphomonas sp. BRH_c22]|uniref:Secreted protein n=2 Tax=Hyphomonas TaxID=85 RepID=A0A062UDB4_9PROT|nr:MULTISPECIES: hypothetical protein [Hyphomonas]KCZ59335.1 hypothetical protein HY30_15175 [Hyphomonas chukchiensis]KDA00357.1 hypothetical protein HOC_19346 [Hyphomonas oceanitis SCH89]KJS34822.1 MAG: hypothetical protein VR74_18870 [Hyphomonas sp. BRH_c22]|tara:strand:+ start:328 stop:621 length:294 start_codon:yes stop_codon:yes gene_type:complete
MLKKFALIASGFAALYCASAQAEGRDDLQRVCVTVSVADGLSEEESQDFCECLATGAEEQGQESIDELVESAGIPDRQARINGLSETSQKIVAVCAP